jgi:hypothetical protein
MVKLATFRAICDKRQKDGREKRRLRKKGRDVASM